MEPGLYRAHRLAQGLRDLANTYAYELFKLCRPLAEQLRQQPHAIAGGACRGVRLWEIFGPGRACDIQVLAG